MVPEDRPEVPATETSLLNRLFRPFRRQTDPPAPLAATQKIVEVFDKSDIQGKLLILGEPGSGKTTELLHLAKDLVKRALKNDSLPIPLILELSAWDENKPFERWIAEMVKQRHGIPKSITQQWLQQDDILPLLDGLDELGLVNQKKCIQAINGFLAERSRYGLIVCCRREEYEAGQVMLDRLNGAVYLEPLRPDQIQTFFQQLNRSRLWAALQNTQTLLDLARLPLFLSMLVVAYRGEPITSEAELFDAFITQKLKEGNSGIYPPNKRPGHHQTLIYLMWLAQQLEHVSETEFLIEGLQPSLLDEDKGEISLYVLVVVLIDLLILGLVVGLTFWLRGWINSKLGEGSNDSLLLGLSLGLSFVVNGLALGVIALSSWWRSGLSAPLQINEKVDFSFYLGLRKGLKTAIVFGVLMGTVIGIGFGIALGRDAGITFGWTTGVMNGLIFGLIKGLIVGLRTEATDEKKNPNQGVRKLSRNSLMGGIIIGFIFGVLFGSLGGKTIGITAGMIFGIIATVSLGLETVIRHIVLRFVLTTNGYTPWNYARFLDHAVDLRFMQRVGGRHRFVHDLLRKHFAAMSLE